MKDKIKQVITSGTIVFIFTDNPKEDIKEFISEYERSIDEDYETEIPLGYEAPKLTTYTFLGNKQDCISLWFDNEDVPDIYVEWLDSKI